MKGSIIKTLVLVALVLVIAIAFVGPSEAEKKIKPIALNGTYAVSGHDVCVSKWTYSPYNLANPTGPSVYWTKTTNIQGIATFNPDGTGYSTNTYLTITHPIYTPIPLGSYWGLPLPPTLPIPGPATNISTITILSNFNYDINPTTRVIVRTPSGVSSGQFTSGPNAGKWLKGSNYNLVGYVSAELGTIVYSSVVTNPPDFPEQADFTTVNEFYTDPSLDKAYFWGSQEDICERSRILTLIKERHF
jgi:hypothetical protein